MIFPRIPSSDFSLLLSLMDSEKLLISPNEKKIEAQNMKIIEWEELQQELARLWSLSSALRKAKEKKDSLVQKLEPLIQVRAESLSQLNEIEEMQQRVVSRKLAMENMLMDSKNKLNVVTNKRKQLSLTIKSLLMAGKALSTACKQLQEANWLLAGERGHIHLKDLRKMLRMRQQYMIAQVSLVYPIKASPGQMPEEKLDFCSNVGKSGDGAGPPPSIISKTKNPTKSTMTILGLQLTVLPLKRMSFFSDKKGVQISATVLGCVAHAVLLIASYLDVQLRYPLRLGGSRSYIFDYAPSVETSSSDFLSNSTVETNLRPVEFPLFVEGQDTTRAAYAIFLLNKDLEQLLNYIGVQSLGPRHVLANLKELLSIIQSPEYLDK